MLQDLWVLTSSVVKGDHVVCRGEFYKVLKSCYYQNESGTIDWSNWIFWLKDDSDQGYFELMLPTYDKDTSHIRVRPCGSSSHCEET